MEFPHYRTLLMICSFPHHLVVEVIKQACSFLCFLGQVSCVDSRAVQLGSLFVRGLTYMLAANSVCGSPFNMEDLMPWRTFDGLLFHQKYLLTHSERAPEELLEGNVSHDTSFIPI